MRAATVVILALGLASARVASAAHAPRIMLMDLPPDPAFPANVNKVVNSFLAKDLRDEGFEVLTPADIAAALGVEKQKQMLGCGDSSCLAEVGGAMGADFILHGELASLSHDTALTLTLSDTKGHALNQVADVVKSQDAEVLLDAVGRDVKKLIQPIRDAGKIAGLKPATTPSATDPSLAASSTPAAAAAAPAPSDQVSHTGSYVTMGVGALLLIGSGVTGALAGSAYSTLNNEATGKQVSGDASISASAASGQRSTMQAEAWASTGLLALGVVAVGVGVVWFFTASPPSAQAGLGSSGAPTLAWSF